MARVFNSEGAPIDYCIQCHPNEAEAREEHGNGRMHPDTGENHFDYDSSNSHPDYEDEEYDCHECGKRLDCYDD